MAERRRTGERREPVFDATPAPGEGRTASRPYVQVVGGCASWGGAGKPARSNWGWDLMRNSALLLAVVLAASFSTVADAAKKKAPPRDPAAQARADSAAFVRAMINPSNSAAGVDSGADWRNGQSTARGKGQEKVAPPPPDLPDFAVVDTASFRIFKVRFFGHPTGHREVRWTMTAGDSHA